jgi:heptosyltransferase-2
VKSILVIQTASIGDVILATPVIEKLHGDFPRATLDLLLKKGNESLFTGHPFLNEVLVWNKNEGKYRDYHRLLHLVRKRKYALVVNLQRFASTGLLTALSGAKMTIGFDKNPFSFLFSKKITHTIRTGGRHETQRNLSLIEGITSPGSAPVKLYPRKEDFARVHPYKTGDYICIAPASLWFTKQYPAEKWVEFIREIRQNVKIFLLGSSADHALCEDILARSDHHDGMNLAGKFSFLETAALMKDALMNYVNDSAPMHLASAMDAPVTAVFCSTVPALGFGPLSHNSAVVETTESLPCRPCGLHGLTSCPRGHFKCAYTITTRQLLERLRT